MSTLLYKIEASISETEENLRKMRHNVKCKTEDIQPYDNEKFLDMVNSMMEKQHEK
jgi:hypothetical protein